MLLERPIGLRIFSRLHAPEAVGAFPLRVSFAVSCTTFCRWDATTFIDHS